MFSIFINLFNDETLKPSKKKKVYYCSLLFKFPLCRRHIWSPFVWLTWWKLISQFIFFISSIHLRKRESITKFNFSFLTALTITIRIFCNIAKKKNNNYAKTRNRLTHRLMMMSRKKKSIWTNRRIIQWLISKFKITITLILRLQP